MRSRQEKKIRTRDTERRTESVEAILAKHWQRHVSEEEAYNSILLALLGYERNEDIPSALSSLTNTKLRPAIEDALQKNKESNHRHMTRIKLFPVKSLAEAVVVEYQAWRERIEEQTSKTAS